MIPECPIPLAVSHDGLRQSAPPCTRLHTCLHNRAFARTGPAKASWIPAPFHRRVCVSVTTATGSAHPQNNPLHRENQGCIPLCSSPPRPSAECT